jgi:predicted nucleic acid-binding protein
MTIFDTDVFTLYAHGNDKIDRRIQNLPDGEVLAVTLITRMEVLRGRFASIEKAAAEADLKVAVERFRQSEEALGRFELVYPDDAAAQHFDRLRRGARTKRMGRPDMLIASIALAHKALLVTRNVDDYKAVAGLEVQDWSR